MRILFGTSALDTAVKKIAKHITEQKHPSPPVMICVLNGAFMFFTDLVKEIKMDCEIDFIRVKSYEGKEQYDIKILKDIESNIDGKNIYIIDDILDSGNTMKALIKHLSHRHKPRSITPIVLFKRYDNEWPVAHGIELKDETWIHGYGLDNEKGLGRNLPYILGDLTEVE